MPFVVSTVSPYRVYSDDYPLFFGGTKEPFYPSLVDELVKDVMIYVIELVVLILYVQNHLASSSR